jgi:hypothetical protein
MIMATCWVALAIHPCSGDPILLQAICGWSMVEAGEGEQERDIGVVTVCKEGRKMWRMWWNEDETGYLCISAFSFKSVMIEFFEKVWCIEVLVIYLGVVHVWVSFPMYEIL